MSKYIIWIIIYKLLNISVSTVWDECHVLSCFDHTLFHISTGPITWYIFKSLCPPETHPDKGWAASLIVKVLMLKHLFERVSHGVGFKPCTLSIGVAVARLHLSAFSLDHWRLTLGAERGWALSTLPALFPSLSQLH